MRAKRPRPLRKGLFHRRYSGRIRFGLRDSQLRGRRHRLAKNAGWYNRRGEKLGAGDLSFEDASRIAASLRKGELFIVLPESALWDLRTIMRGGKRELLEKDRARERSPGRAYVAERAIIVLAPRKRYIVYPAGLEPRRRVVRFRRGVRFEILRRPALRQMLGLRP